MLGIVGDINFSDGFFDTGFGVGSSLKNGADPFKNLQRNNEDFWIGNFECVCAINSNKEGTQSKQFRINPGYLSHIRHLDLYAVANNHVMQHGDAAYNEMLRYLTNLNVAYVGSQNKKSTIFEHQGEKVGILAFSQRPENFSDDPLYWALPVYIEIQEEFKKLKNCDFRIAYIHWGNEFINRPYNDQQQFAHWLIDIGFDLIIGTHPHILQGYEVYKNKYIFYSIGNFVFNMPWKPTKYSTIVNVDVKNNFKISYDYVHIEKDYFPKIVNASNVPEKYKFEFLNSLINLNQENEIYYKNVYNYRSKYRKANYKYILNNFLNYKFSDISQILLDFIKRKLK